MARNFRGSRFRSRSGAGLGEDVNPQAYIVNLADCMLVLACGFMVALVSAYNLNISPYEQVDQSQLDEVQSETITDEALQNGSSFIEAGTAYYDPSTGTYYIRESADGESGETVTDSASSTSSGSTGSSSTAASDAAAREAKANGAD